MLKSILAAILGLVAYAEPIWQKEFTLLEVKTHEIDSIENFNEWAAVYNKVYSCEEEAAYKYLQWVETVYKIGDHNEQGLSYKMGLNQFSDLSPEEFTRYVHGKDGRCFKPDQPKLTISKLTDDSLSSSSSSDDINAPTSVDWTTKGVVTPVKNQGQCGSCWSFSTTGALECDYAIKTGTLTSLSEQQLVDCAGAIYGCAGCNGGEMTGAMRYSKNEGGLCSEKEYPYKARGGSCQASSCGTKYDHNSGEQQVTSDSETSLMNAVASGCVSIAIEADQSAFQSYRSGVLTGNCGTNLDHGVLVVGYGTESGQDYWKVKNSWGTSWGEQGYIKICRNCNKNNGRGECGILMQPLVPTF